jgi:hypothetical protein
MTIKKILLAGVALCSLSVAPAVANSAAPHVHLTALHPGAVVKSTMHSQKVAGLTYTFLVYSSVTNADYMQKTNLAATFYKWNDSYNICTTPKETITLSTTKTVYAALSTATETVPGSEEGCKKTVTFYGDVYELTTKKGNGKTDTFTSTLSAKIKDPQGKFNANLILDVDVAISKK